MSTLIAVYKGTECIGRCDAKCYEATCGTCDCVCGGKNHGAGLEKARENTREYAEAWIERYKREKGIPEGKGRLSTEVSQLNLF